MSKTSKNADSTTMPGDIVSLPAYSRIVDEIERVPVKYGDKQEVLPISATERVSIDAYFFQSATNFRLKKIKTAVQGLKKAGVKVDGKDVDSVWFNANVRDPFHKVLRFAAKHSLEHGKPVSLAFTRRTIKSTGEQIVTAKHAFEHTVTGPKVEAIADKAAVAAKAAKQSATRAKRQKRNRPMPGNSVGAAIEGATKRIDATAPEPVPATA